jgi:L-rhamnose-H+ transport protein
LKKGFLVALLSGVMSSCFAYGLAAGDPIKVLTVRAGTPSLWQGLPVLVVVLFGGFTTNFAWSMYLNIRNRTGGEYFASVQPSQVADPGDLQTIDETAFVGRRQVCFRAHRRRSCTKQRPCRLCGTICCAPSPA